MTKIVLRLGWKYISIVYEESNYGIKVGKDEGRRERERERRIRSGERGNTEFDIGIMEEGGGYNTIGGRRREEERERTIEREDERRNEKRR